MQRLILMRHAEAEAARGRRDHERLLSKTGRREAAAAGRSLAAAGPVPDIALVSDSARTLATFESVSAAFASAPPCRVLPELYGASPDTILAALGGLPEQVGTVLVIGHNPGVGNLARALAGDGDEAELSALQAHFPTACCAVLRLGGEGRSAIVPGRLERLIGGKSG